MLTKTELEEIWETKPHGYFPKLVKDLKSKTKLTKFKVTGRVLEITEKEVASVSELVYAKTAKDYQIRDAEAKIRSVLYKDSRFVHGCIIRYKIEALT